MVNKTDTPLYKTRDNGYYDVDNPGGQYGTQEPDSTPGDSTFWANNPNEQLGFEITPNTTDWSFTPEFYPEDFTFVKKRELKRYGGNCGGESVSIKATKNREFHARGLMTVEDLAIFNHLVDYSKETDIISPIIPGGGMECYIKKGEIGNQKGVDPITGQRIFEYSIDLVSTGRDEYDTGRNKIVTAIAGSSEGASSESQPSIQNDPARDITIEGVLSLANLDQEFEEGSAERRSLSQVMPYPYQLGAEDNDNASIESIKDAVLGLTDSEASAIKNAASSATENKRDGTPYPLDGQSI